MPYKGEAAAHLDMFGGVLDTAWANPATARTHLQAGKIKVLGIIGSRRVGTIPSVPTFTEQGFEGFGARQLDGLLRAGAHARAGGRQAGAALREITQSPELRGKLLDMGFEPVGTTPDAFANDIKSQLPAWAGWSRPPA